MTKTVGLVMIVKNEAKIIARCLESARRLTDYVLVVDTGSSDGTPEIVEAYLRGERLAGKVVSRPWVNFAHNRSEALKLLREITDIDYGLTIDADETFELDPGLDVAVFKATLNSDVYDLEVRLAGIAYSRPALFSNRLPFEYKAVLHEYLELPDGATHAAASGVRVICTSDGARSQNPDKFRDDARTLERALQDETDPFLRSRYTFYLAQSHFDARNFDSAYDYYLQRVALGYWIEERYVSLVRAAQASEQLGHPADVQLALYLRAYDLIPTRAEALHGAAAVCRRTSLYALGFRLAGLAVQIHRPASALFLDRAVYEFRALDELQVCAYWSGHPTESLAASEELLQRNLPADDRTRIEVNAAYAREKVASLKAAA